MFVSSVIGGMESYREAAAQATGTLDHEPRMAEDYGASSSTPQETCLRGVREADVTVLLLGARYGARQESGLSATHEEYREARGRSPVLAFVQENVEYEADQKEFLGEVQDWTSGQYTADFSTPDTLRDAVTRGLHQLELSLAAGPTDENEMLARAEQQIPAVYGYGTDILSVVVAGGPRQQILRPAQLEGEDLSEALMQEALFGPARILESTQGTNKRLQEHTLVIEQDTASFRLDELGTVSIAQSARKESRPRSGDLPVLIKEDISNRVERALLFAGWVLDRIDKPKRLSDVVVVAALVGSSYLGWRTRAEYEANPGSGPMSMKRSDRIRVQLSPARRNRAALKLGAHTLAEDLTILIGREVQS